MRLRYHLGRGSFLWPLCHTAVLCRCGFFFLSHRSRRCSGDSVFVLVRSQQRWWTIAEEVQILPREIGQRISNNAPFSQCVLIYRFCHWVTRIRLMVLPPSPRTIQNKNSTVLAKLLLLQLLRIFASRVNYRMLFFLKRTTSKQNTADCFGRTESINMLPSSFSKQEKDRTQVVTGEAEQTTFSEYSNYLGRACVVTIVRLPFPLSSLEP